MDYFNYQNGQLYCEDVNLNELTEAIGTPFFVYSKKTFEEHYERFLDAFKELNPTICFSIKTCNNIHLLKLLIDKESGMDVVSGGELYRAKLAGADMKKIVYAGVGKTDDEIRQALDYKIGWFNIESEQEFENIACLAREMNCKVKAALRINPDVTDAKTHKKTQTGQQGSKFGIDIDRAKEFYRFYGKHTHLQLSGVHVHLGSPIYSSPPYVKAIKKILVFIEELNELGFNTEVINIGGGFAADYKNSDEISSWHDYASEIIPLLKPFVEKGGQIIFEPGRTISANSGVLVTKVQYVKTNGGKHFAIVDTGMSHLIRPTLYESYHHIWPTKVSGKYLQQSDRSHLKDDNLKTYDIVGPVCESSDYLAKNRSLPVIKRGDLLAIFSAGAYGMVMASQYNAIPRPPEILVDGNKSDIIRFRETYNDLVALEMQSIPLQLPQREEK